MQAAVRQNARKTSPRFTKSMASSAWSTVQQFKSAIIRINAETKRVSAIHLFYRENGGDFSLYHVPLAWRCCTPARSMSAMQCWPWAKCRGITNENETPGRAVELLCLAFLLHKNDNTTDF